MPLIIISLGILLLFFLIIIFRLNTFLAFIIVSLSVGIAQGMELNSIVISIEKGIGNTLGFLIIILALGAMLGKQVANSGAAQKITEKLIDIFGVKNTQWAVMITGFIVGITMFYDVGFVILVPLVFNIAFITKLPLLYIALPMLASLSVTHGFLPPHPAPSALTIMFEANMGKTLLYGFAVAIPSIIISGPILIHFIKKVDAKPLKEFIATKTFKKEELPTLFNSLFSALLPVLLIGGSTIVLELISEENKFYSSIKFFGNPVIALLIAVLISIYSLGITRGEKIKNIMQSFGKSISGITMILLIIAGSGALKQILIDSGVSNYIGGILNESNISPLLLGWLIATILRVSIGSATVAGLTTAGIVLPLVQSGGVNPELMVLAIGSGSLMLSHVNDGGFWLFKEYFNLSIKDTLATWTVMETSIGISGLVGVLILNYII